MVIALTSVGGYVRIAPLGCLRRRWLLSPVGVFVIRHRYVALRDVFSFNFIQYRGNCGNCQKTNAGGQAGIWRSSWNDGDLGCWVRNWVLFAGAATKPGF